MQAYLGGIEGQALDGLQKGLDGVIAGGTAASLLCFVLLLSFVLPLSVVLPLCVAHYADI